MLDDSLGCYAVTAQTKFRLSNLLLSRAGIRLGEQDSGNLQCQSKQKQVKLLNRTCQIEQYLGHCRQSCFRSC